MPAKRDPVERFMEKLEKSDGCWVWTGSKTGGYGMLSINGQPYQAHRFSYELANGPIPDGLVIDHLCRNRACVNPAHLEAVPMAENTRRGDLSKVTKERFASRTHCKHGHEMTPENTYETGIKGTEYTRRQCRTCKREATARAREKRKSNA